MCNFTRTFPGLSQNATIAVDLCEESPSLVAPPEDGGELCWMLPPDRGTAWSHCVGQGDVDGPTFADTKSQARAYVSFTVIIIAASLCFIFKCPWTRTRLRAQRLAEQRGSPTAQPRQPGPAVGRGRDPGLEPEPEAEPEGRGQGAVRKPEPEPPDESRP